MLCCRILLLSPQRCGWLRRQAGATVGYPGHQICLHIFHVPPSSVGRQNMLATGGPVMLVPRPMTCPDGAPPKVFFSAVCKVFLVVLGVICGILCSLKSTKDARSDNFADLLVGSVVCKV